MTSNRYRWSDGTPVGEPNTLYRVKWYALTPKRRLKMRHGMRIPTGTTLHGSYEEARKASLYPPANAPANSAGLVEKVEAQ